MVNRVVEEFVMFPFEFISPTGITIEETAQGVAILTGILLREGVSRNGNAYTIKEMKNIAKQAEGMPLFFGTMSKIDPNVGIRKKNLHANIEKNRVGRIIRAVFDKAKRVIKYWAELVNTEAHPTIIEEVKAGWGISIGGIATKARVVFDGVRLLTKVIGMKLSHVQLLRPWVTRGQDAAQVEGVEVQNKEIQESMIFYEYAPISKVVEVKLGFGIEEVTIS